MCVCLSASSISTTSSPISSVDLLRRQNSPRRPDHRITGAGTSRWERYGAIMQSSRSPNDRRRVIIIGGGASGVLLACHLLRRPVNKLEVTLVEKRPDVGRGIAYHTANPDHLLNVRAANMSAFPDEPDHFWRWVCARQGGC